MNRTKLLCLTCLSAWTAYSCSQTGPNAAGTMNGTGGVTQTTDTGAGGSQSTSAQKTSASSEGGEENKTTQAEGGSENGAGGAEASGGRSQGENKGGASSGKSSSNSASNGGTGFGSSAKSSSAAQGGSSGAKSSTSVATTGGATHTTVATSASNTPTANDVVPDLAVGFYWEGTCKGATDPSNHGCFLTADSSSPSGGIDIEKVLDVKGVKDQLYTVTIEVRGVIGTRCYKNGKRASTEAPSETDPNNWWYIGGTYANPTGWWNSYELHVAPATGDASGDVYYFNGLEESIEAGAWCEKEATYAVKYNASFKVKGGGTMTFKIHDQNGKALENCGRDAKSDPVDTCNYRIVDLAGMAAQPPASFKQPPTNFTSKTWYPQWLWIVADSVAVVQ